MSDNDVIPVNINLADFNPQKRLLANQTSSGVNLNSNETISFGNKTINTSMGASFTNENVCANNENLPKLLNGETQPLNFSNMNVNLDFKQQNYSSYVLAEGSGFYVAEKPENSILNGQLRTGYYLADAAEVSIDASGNKSPESFNSDLALTAQTRIKNTELALRTSKNYENNGSTVDTFLLLEAFGSQRLNGNRISTGVAYEMGEGDTKLNVWAGGQFQVKPNLNIYSGVSYDRTNSSTEDSTQTKQAVVNGEYRVNDMSFNASCGVTRDDSELSSTISAGLNYSPSSSQQISLAYEHENLDGKDNNSVNVNTTVNF